MVSALPEENVGTDELPARAPILDEYKAVDLVDRKRVQHLQVKQEKGGEQRERGSRGDRLPLDICLRLHAPLRRNMLSMPLFFHYDICAAGVAADASRRLFGKMEKHRGRLKIVMAKAEKSQQSTDRKKKRTGRA